MTAPLIVLLLMVMPVRVGGAVPVGVIVPFVVLVTLPVGCEFWILMQLMAAEFVIGLPTELATSLMSQAANAAGVPLPISTAARELDASSRRNLPRPMPPPPIRYPLPPAALPRGILRLPAAYPTGPFRPHYLYGAPYDAANDEGWNS